VLNSETTLSVYAQGEVPLSRRKVLMNLNREDHGKATVP